MDATPVRALPHAETFAVALLRALNHLPDLGRFAFQLGQRFPFATGQLVDGAGVIAAAGPVIESEASRIGRPKNLARLRGHRIAFFGELQHHFAGFRAHDRWLLLHQAVNPLFIGRCNRRLVLG